MQGITPVAVKRGAWVRDRVGAKNGLFFVSKMVNLVFHPLLCFLIAPFINSLLIDSSISNILNVSRT